MSETGTDGFEVIDVKEQIISGSDLDTAKEKVGSYEDLFNKRAIRYRQQGWNEKELTDSDFKELILKEYTFMKRPLYFIDDEVFAGNAKKIIEAIKAKLSE